MAQLALGAAGAVAGFYLGGPQGAQIGFMLGSVAGGMVDRAMAKPIQGPRLTDLSVSASTYGNPIPEIMGTVRLSGNMIWSTGLREQPHKTSASAKAPKQVTYTYDASFAFSFCRGPAARVLRIWLDKKLVFDCTSSGEAIAVKGLIHRFYAGTEVQLPDTAIVAKEGANAPAHRGLCYIVFDSVALAPFGNRIPNVEAEMTTDAVDTDVVTTIVNLSPSNGNPFVTDSHATSHPAVDWTRKIALRGYTNPSGHSVSLNDITAGVELRAKTVADMHAGTAYEILSPYVTILGVSPGGAAYYATTGSSVCLSRFDPISLTITGQHAHTGSGFTSDIYTRLPGAANITTTQILWEGTPRELVLYTSHFGFIRIIDGGTMESIWGMTEATGGPDIVDAPDYGRATLGNVNAHMCAGEQRLGETDVWILTSGNGLSSGTEEQRKPRLQLAIVGSVATFVVSTGSTMGLRYSTVAVLDPATIHPGATRVAVSGLQYDPSDNCVVFVSEKLAGTGDSYRLVKVDDTGALVWTTKLTGDPAMPSGTARLDGTIYATAAQSTGQVIELRSGAESRTYTSTNTGSQYVYDGESRSALAQFSPAALRRIYPDRATAQPVALPDVVSWLCDKAGLDPAEIDVSDLDDEVIGFVRGQEPVRESIAALQAAYFFDPVEEDDVLVFRPRGGAAVASVAFAQVVRRDDGAPAVTVRQRDETDLPRRLWVDFRDVAKDQQSNSIAWSRALGPTVMVHTRQETRLNLSSIVMDASRAKTIAMRHALSAYSERYSIESLGLTFEHLALNAADAITLELPDGVTQRVRLQTAAVGDDYTLSADVVFEDASIWTMETTGSSGDGHVVQTVPASYASRLLFANLPLLQDADDAGGTGLRFYAGAGGYGAGWRGATLFGSADGTAWERVSAVLTGMSWGIALARLPAPRVPWSTDRTGTLRIVMESGGDAVEDVTEAQMLAGANRALLIAADGSAELLAFADVTANADGSYTLSTLLRGLRGTEWASGRHAPGDLFVLVNDALVEVLLPLAALNTTRYARAVGRADDFDAVAAIGRTITGAAEKPYAPVHIEGARDGSGNLTITALRRSRIGGREWVDGSETVPQPEESEAYELDILSGEGGTVLRTITGLSTPSAAYSAANQVTDFGSAQAEVAVAFYQVSATVGRGYAGAAKV